MKRPRWLGGPGSAADDDTDGETAAESAGRRAGKQVGRPRPEESAAERSARRTATGKPPEAAARSSRSARRTLGERVGKATEDPSKGSEDEEPTDHEPKRKPEGDKPRDDKPKRKPDPGDRKSEGAGDRKELHRPRRQDDDERHQDPKAKRKRGETARARSKRKPIGKRVGIAAGRSGKALKHAVVATRKQATAAAPKVGLGILTVLGGFYTVFFAVFGFVLGVLISVWLFVARPVGWVLTRLSRLTNAASRLLTPIRTLALVVAGASVLLALSQYADYRSISIGNGAYADGLQAVAPAPETGRLETGDAHSYIFVPIAIACLLLLGGALTGRWRLCRLISFAGAAAIGVALFVDRPAGLDAGDAALAFNGADATLLGGFYAQIAAGVLLIGSSSMLARALRLAGATERSGVEAGHEGERRRGKGERALRRTDAGGARA